VGERVEPPALPSTKDIVGDQYGTLPNGTIQAGRWYEFASVIDRSAGTVRAYLDGKEILNETIRTNTAVGDASSLYIGSDPASLYHFRGMVEDLAVWNAPRTAAQIRADFASGIDDGAAELAGHWRFEDVVGTSVQDSSANDQSGFRIGGNPTFGPVRLAVSDTLGDPLDVLAFSDSDQVSVSVDGAYLLVTPAPGFTGTVRITMVARDGSGAPHDWAWRRAMSFDISFGRTRSTAANITISTATAYSTQRRRARSRRHAGFPRHRRRRHPRLRRGGLSTPTPTATTRSATSSSRAGRYGPAALVGAPATANGGAGVFQDSDPTPSTAFTSTSATFLFGGDGRAHRPRVRRQRWAAAPASATLDLGANSTVGDAPALPARPGAQNHRPADQTSQVAASVPAARRRGERRAAALHFRWRRTLAFVTPERVLQAGLWHDVAAVVDRDALAVHVYVDGEEVLFQGAEFQASQLIGAPLTIGGDGNPEGFSFRGEIDQLAVWKIARSREEVAEDFAGIDPKASGLSAYWAFDEGAGGQASDASPNKNDALLGTGAQAPAWFGNQGNTHFEFAITLTPAHTRTTSRWPTWRLTSMPCSRTDRAGARSAQIIGGKLAFVGAPDVAAFAVVATSTRSATKASRWAALTFSTLPQLRASKARSLRRPYPGRAGRRQPDRRRRDRDRRRRRRQDITQASQARFSPPTRSS
jgi:hypothetical protein